MTQKRTTPKLKSQKSSASKKDRARQKVKWKHLDPDEQLSAICKLFMKGMTMTEISKVVSKKYDTDFSREKPYPLLMKAVRKKWIRYMPPQEGQLGWELKQKYDWLFDVRVVHTSQYSDIANYGAETLLDLLKTFRGSNKKEIHIGFAGGHAMRILAGQFARLLENLNTPFPKKLVLHALVSGFDIKEPTTDPNTFFTLFQSDPTRGIEYGYVGLHAPPLVESKHYDELMLGPGFCDSKDLTEDIDIIVTSATCWNDEHSTFRKYMDNFENCSEKLEKEGCIGDMLWQPLGKRKRIKPDMTAKRAMALYDLDELSGFVKNEKNVLLVLGPCGQCYQPKTSILKAILDQDNQLITHLVADSRSVREIMKA
jgi:hypothetical protein